MRFSFFVLHRSSAYWLVIGLFVGANLWSWLRYRRGIDEYSEITQSVGFPFPFHVRSEVTGSGDFLLTGLLLDIVVAWTLAALATWISLSAWSRAGQQSNDADD